MAIMSKWLVAVIIFVIGYAIETVLVKWQAGLKVKWPINILTVINGILCFYMIYRVVTEKIIFFYINMG